MEDDLSRKVRRTIPAVLDGQLVRLLVEEHTPERRPDVIEKVYRQRQATPSRGVYVIVRGQPIREVEIGKLEIIE